VNRRGIALLSALAAVTVAGLLAALTLAVARLSRAEGLRQVSRLQAGAVAAGAAARRTAQWDTSAAELLAIGAEVGLGGNVVATGVRSRDSLRRLGPDLYLLRAEGQKVLGSGEILAREVISRLVERLVLPLPDSATILAPRLELDSTAVVSGMDRAPPGWSGRCPPPGSPRPPWLADSAPLGPGTRTMLSQLLPLADIRIGGVLSPLPVSSGPGECSGSALNWGDPAGGPCADRFPAIVLEPGSRIVDGTGQGLMVALDTVELSGNFCFTGAIVALGPLSMRGHSCVSGVIVGLASVEIREQAQVELSVCAADRAVRAPGRFRGVPRGWSAWR
jgi:hypothetical protein